MQQGSDEWRQARCGSVGSSEAPKVVRRTKSGYSADRDNLMAAKVIERLTQVPTQGFTTQAMQQGIEREPLARMTYGLIKGVEVDEIGIVLHPSVMNAHASPDGLVGDDGLIEIKCPQPAAHLEALISETIPNDHRVQMLWQMACTGRQWCDYVSFNPDFPSAMQMWVCRVPRDPALIAELEREIAAFNREVERKVAELSRRYLRAA